MADVIPFRRARLTGFIPETETTPDQFKNSDNHQGERNELIGHARSGRPPINLAEPFTGGEYPCDTEPPGAA